VNAQNPPVGEKFATLESMIDNGTLSGATEELYRGKTRVDDNTFTRGDSMILVHVSIVRAIKSHA